jgi:FkbM family methyltransferase
MSNLSQKLAKVGRIPERLSRDAWLIENLQNWREALEAEWRGTPLKQVKIRNGVVIESPGTIDLAFLFQETWRRAIYSPAGFEIEPGNTVIDIGANIGVFAIFAATRAAAVRVFSYEPFPENMKWLRNNIRLSGLKNVQARQQAVGAESGIRTLQISPHNWIVHSLFGDNGDANQLSVECVSFDEVMNQHGIECCDLLKLDCEGSEYEILQKCAPETLKRVRRIVGEYHEGPHIEGTGEGLCRFLESRSFRVDNFHPGESCGVFTAHNLDF